MQWLKGIITALAVTILTTILLAAFQRPIADYFAPDRLTATVEIGPWYPLVNEKNVKNIPEATGLSENFANYFMDEDHVVARVTLENNSPKTISEIRFRHVGISDPYVVVSEGDKPTYDLKGQVHSLALPDLKPGQSTKIYMWRLGGFGYPTYFDDVRTYSSEGPWRVEVKSPRTLNEELQLSPFGQFVVDWGDWVLEILLFGLVIAVAIWGGIYAAYVGDLLSDAAYYEAERHRYDVDPKKFRIQMEGLGSFSSKYLMDRKRAIPAQTKDDTGDATTGDTK